MRPFNRNANVNRGSGGGPVPLISDHLRDLDLELELLKRKREMIEKQQNLLNQQQAFNRVSYNYDQPQSFRNHQPFDDGPQYSGSNHAFSHTSRDFSNSNRDFSQLYDEPQQSHNNYPRQSAKKRLGDYVWNHPPHKRTFVYDEKPLPPKKSKYVPPSERPGFNMPKGGKPKPSQRFREAPSQAPGRRPRPNDFNPTKVTKPNKPANKPKMHPVPKVNEGSPILYADRVPSQQTAGRLELALGTILKDVKDKYGKVPAYAHCFGETNSAREMKQLIRERIRETMLGKPVGNISHILKNYRDVYPAATDKDIIEAGIMKNSMRGGKTTTFAMSTGQMNPYQFFKRNYTRLLSVSLNKMFARLETIAKEESELILKMEKQEKDLTKSSDVTGEVINITEDTEPSKDDNAKDAGNSEGNSEKPEETVEKPAENAEKPAEIAETPAENSEELAENAEKTEENAESLAETAETPAETAEKLEGNSVKPKKDTITEKSEEDKAVAEVIRKKYETMLDEVMLKRLAMWLPRLKSQIMEALSHDITFERAKQAVIKETNVRLNMANEPIQPGSEISKLEEAIVNKKPHNLDYHVKIQGRPTLPKKSMMTEFLKEFNPKLVKKIKNVRNLLYVGFDNKNDFDRMVAANGTFVGTDKIIVKISQWVTNSALNAPNKSTSTPNTSAISDQDVSMKDATEENNDGLNDTLDNQIDELLTSIRNEEESEHVEDNKEHVEAVQETNVDEKENATDNDDVVETQESEVPNEAEQPANEAEEINLDDNENGNEETQETNQDKVGETNQDKVEETNQDKVEEENQDNEEESKNVENTDTDEAKDKFDEVKTKETGKATPVRTSTRLASAPTTPSTIRTRRASKLAQN